MEGVKEGTETAGSSMTAEQFLVLATAYAGVIIVSLFAIAVLIAILRGKIDLSLLLSEADGSASMSRFQFLIFTFVIGFGLILVIVNGMKFPEEVPGGVMALLGISGGTYAVSKGIRKANEKPADSAGTRPGKRTPGP